MKFTKLVSVLAMSLWMVPGCVVGEDPVDTTALEAGGGHGSGDCHPAPVMHDGDFDGDGVIDSDDLDMISAYNEAGDYAAFFDMNADGKLNGADVSAVATKLGQAAHPRDAQMAALWATTEPYRDIRAAYAAGYVPFTPDLAGHGIHFANFNLIYSWGSRGFQPGAPEGLNYSATGRLLAAFYYAPGAVDLAELPGGFPIADTYYLPLPVPASLVGEMPHIWHNHTGACFGGATSPVPGFDQCMTQDACDAVGGQLWSDKFHMLHVWMYEYNACGPFAGVDEDVSPDAPPEPNHHACTLDEVVPCVVGLDADGNLMINPDTGLPMCHHEGGGHDGHDM